MNSKLRDLVQIPLMAAIIFVAAYMIHIPTVGGGMVHLGDSMIFIAAVVLGKKRGAYASAVGMALFDILSGFAIWAPFTFIIKGTMAYIAGDILSKSRNLGFKAQLPAFLAASIFMVPAYFLAQVLIGALITGELGWKVALIYALKDVPANIFQVGAGIVIAMPLLKGLEKTTVLNRGKN
ncbi:ECF transporter S component [Alloiococcus sp. CFN-8]|uniref:ECF transporter S component n=1 Tax=Alloiococcus sp. CFN-8 TaxID=3416081 RepID=UPI003CEC8F6A